MKNLYDQALSDLNKAIELDPQYSNAYFTQGDVYAKKQIYDSAILNYTKAIEFTPDYADAYYFRAKAYLLIKDYDKAWDDLHKAKELKFEIEPEFVERLKEESGREQ